VIIDVNANLSRWPFRRTPCDEERGLLDTLRAHGVGQAWVGSLDGLFHRDLGGVNRRLAEACRRADGVELLPFGSVNPMLPDWQEDLRRCAEDYRMPGIRLHPGYHGYRLDEPVFAELIDRAADRGLIVQLAVRMEDVRVQHPLMRIPDVDTRPLVEMLASRPGVRLVLLGALATLRGQPLRELADGGRAWFEISMKEGVGGVAALLRDVPPSRVLFGSHLPLFSLESAVLKMRESELSDSHRRAVEHGNAAGLLAGGGPG
jgi:uncharacterized protein